MKFSLFLSEKIDIFRPDSLMSEHKGLVNNVDPTEPNGTDLPSLPKGQRCPQKMHKPTNQ